MDTLDPQENPLDRREPNVCAMPSYLCWIPSLPSPFPSLTPHCHCWHRIMPCLPAYFAVPLCSLMPSYHISLPIYVYSLALSTEYLYVHSAFPSQHIASSHSHIRISKVSTSHSRVTHTSSCLVVKVSTHVQPFLCLPITQEFSLYMPLCLCGSYH